jgi:ferredoxin
MSIFINVDVEFGRCRGLAKCGLCLRVCPVNIFAKDTGSDPARVDLPFLVNDAFDECTLCNLCVQNCQPDAIRIDKLYEKSGPGSGRRANGRST